MITVSRFHYYCYYCYYYL